MAVWLVLLEFATVFRTQRMCICVCVMLKRLEQALSRSSKPCRLLLRARSRFRASIALLVKRIRQQASSNSKIDAENNGGVG